MSVMIPAGQGITLTGTFLDTAGLPVTPTTGSLVITDPTGAVSTYDFGSLDNPSVGVYQRTIAPILPGRWTYVFHATSGVLAALPGTFSVAPEDWTPTVADVGRKLHSRTIDTNGNQIGTFNDQTRPTSTEVAAIIEEETGAMLGFNGPNIPDALWALAHNAALLRVAARIELDYFPEQVPTGRSPRADHVGGRDTEEGRLISALRAHRATLDTGAGAGVYAYVTRPQAAIDSETLPLPSDDVPPYTPTGWPLADPQTGSAGTTV